MTLRAVIFDLDGVLIDTERLHFEAWKAALGRQGVDLLPAAYSRVAGLQGDAIAVLFVDGHQLDVPAPDLLAAKTAILHGRLRSGAAELLPHARETLTTIGAWLPLGLATGGSREETSMKLEKTGLARHFRGIVTRSDVARGKPHPDLYRRVTVLLGVDPLQALAVEDSPAGVAAAKAAGLRCVAVPGEFTKGQDFTAADDVCESLRDVEAMTRQGRSS